MAIPHPRYVSLAFPLAVDQAFTYAIPEGIQGPVQPGCRARALLRNKPEIGFIVEVHTDPPIDPDKIIPFDALLDPEPLILPEQMELARFVAGYYCCSIGEALHAVYPFSPDLSPKVERVLQLELNGKTPEEILDSLPKRAPALRKCVEFALNEPEPRTATELTKAAEVSSGVVAKLVQQGLLVPSDRRIHRKPGISTDFDSSSGIQLNGHQTNALAHIEEALAGHQTECFLLHGVTGSGKTEVYLRAIAHCLNQGRTALVLVPEIALTPQAAARYKGRFGERIAVLHSALGAGERFDEYHAVRSGDRPVVVGTRSAVFAPLQNLGLVVVDEEHDGSYKQDSVPRYNGRDVAVWRARKFGAVCILGSATPSVESTLNAQKKKYGYLALPQRAVPHGLPQVELIDMRGRSSKEALLSSELETALGEILGRKEQAILLLNRRGYANAVLCRNCGQIIECESCTIAMVYHRDGENLLCHHCDKKQPVPRKCPSCEEQWIRYRGIGTEQLEEYVSNKFPKARLERLDFDSTRRKGAHGEILGRFWRQEADILIGTQMVAKGIDIPGVTLVGVLSADAALTIPDFRAAERTFALLTQVAGRAGRGINPGRVIIQSHCPNHYSVRAALKHDYKSFYVQEIGYRKAVRFPPFSRLAGIEVSSEDPEVAYDHAVALTEIIHFMMAGPLKKALRVIGPVEAPIWKVKNRYRWHILVLASTHRAMSDVLNNEGVERAMSRKVKDVRVTVDVDPLNLL